MKHISFQAQDAKIRMTIDILRRNCKNLHLAMEGTNVHVYRDDIKEQKGIFRSLP